MTLAIYVNSLLFILKQIADPFTHIGSCRTSRKRMQLTIITTEDIIRTKEGALKKIRMFMKEKEPKYSKGMAQKLPGCLTSQY